MPVYLVEEGRLEQVLSPLGSRIYAGRERANSISVQMKERDAFVYTIFVFFWVAYLSGDK